jgi:hypothetical protein
VLGDQTVGEICLRGNNVMSAYYKGEAETQKAFGGDAWLKTGDLGMRDEDGFYFITGRLKELIIKGGENIAGPHVAELGNSGKYIFGRIEPKKGIPPHPDHAPGFFVIDSDTDKVTTGLDRDKWLTELKAVGNDAIAITAAFSCPVIEHAF